MDVACLSEQIVFGPEIARGDLGQRHFGQARLGDQRRTARLVKSANKILEHPGGSLPQKMKDHKDLIALDRLVDRPETTHAAVIESHGQRTRQLMGACKGVVLVIHDTTELDYTTRTVLKKMGPLGNGSQRGYLCHNSLAVTATVLLQLRQAGRDPQAGALLATVLVPMLWVQVLSAWRYGQVREETSVLEFCMALARLGGHQNRKGDGLPGWLTLWRGWCELQAMIRGVEALRKAEAMK